MNAAPLPGSAAAPEGPVQALLVPEAMIPPFPQLCRWPLFSARPQLLPPRRHPAAAAEESHPPPIGTHRQCPMSIVSGSPGFSTGQRHDAACAQLLPVAAKAPRPTNNVALGTVKAA